MSHSRKEGVVVKNLHIYVIALTPTSPPFMKTHIATMFCPPPPSAPFRKFLNYQSTAVQKFGFVASPSPLSEQCP